VLRGHVEAIRNDEPPGTALVHVVGGEELLLARLTKRAVASLDVAVGRKLWVQVKSVALLDWRQL
jgi:molybdate transport system ATP-binding protein